MTLEVFSLGCFSGFFISFLLIENHYKKRIKILEERSKKLEESNESYRKLASKQGQIIVVLKSKLRNSAF